MVTQEIFIGTIMENINDQIKTFVNILLNVTTKKLTKSCQLCLEVGKANQRIRANSINKTFKIMSNTDLYVDIVHFASSIEFDTISARIDSQLHNPVSYTHLTLPTR